MSDLRDLYQEVILDHSKKPRNHRKIADADHHVMEMWGPDPTGKQFKTMEIRYTRKK